MATAKRALMPPDERPHCLKCKSAMHRDGRYGDGYRWRCAGCGASARNHTITRPPAKPDRSRQFIMPEGGAACPRCRKLADKLAVNLFRCAKCRVVVTVHPMLEGAAIEVPAVAPRAALAQSGQPTDRPCCMTCRKPMSKAKGTPDKPRWRCGFCAVEIAGYTTGKPRPGGAHPCQKCGSRTKRNGGYRSKAGAQVLYFRCQSPGCGNRQRSDGRPIASEKETAPACRLCDSPTRQAGGYQPKEGDRVVYYKCSNPGCGDKQRSDGMPIGVKRRAKPRIKRHLHAVIQTAARDVGLEIREDVERELAALLTEMPETIMDLRKAVKACERNVRLARASKPDHIKVDHEDFRGFARRRPRKGKGNRTTRKAEKGASHDEKDSHEKEEIEAAGAVEAVEEAKHSITPAVQNARKCKRSSCPVCRVRQAG